MNTGGAFTQMVSEQKKGDTWYDVQKKLQNAHFVSCVENYSLTQIIADLKATYKGTRTTQQIADAVMACCKQRDKKISSQLFLVYVITKLS